MMQPKVGDAMMEMAKRSGGQYSTIDQDGKVHKGGGMPTHPGRKHKHY